MNNLQSIPRTHQGEHLAYISPQEAQMLRQQGGGMAPDGGQLQGPGGIPSFQVGGGGADIAQRAAGDMAFFQQMLPEYTSVQHLNQSKGGSYAQAGQPGFRGAIMAERMRMDKEARTPEPEPVERDLSEDIAERQKDLDDTLTRGAERQTAMYANLGYGAPPSQYGQLSTGEQLFPQNASPQGVPAYANLLGNPAIAQALQQSGLQAVSATQAPQSLQNQVNTRAQEIRTAAQGGLIKRYDLGGLVNTMLLQASRSRDSIPSNAVS